MAEDKKGKKTNDTGLPTWHLEIDPYTGNPVVVPGQATPAKPGEKVEPPRMKVPGSQTYAPSRAEEPAAAPTAPAPATDPNAAANPYLQGIKDAIAAQQTQAARQRSVTTQQQEINPATLQTVLNNAAIQMLGRNLTKQELNNYTKQYRTLESENISTTVSNPVAGGTDVLQEQARSQDELVKDIFQDTPGYAQHQIDTNVLDMFLNRIKGGSVMTNG